MSGLAVPAVRGSSGPEHLEQVEEALAGRRRRPSPGRAGRRARRVTSSSATSAPDAGQGGDPAGLGRLGDALEQGQRLRRWTRRRRGRRAARRGARRPPGGRARLEDLAQRGLVALGQQLGQRVLLLGGQEALARTPARRPRAGRRRSRRPPCRPRSAYTAGMPCTWKASATWRLASTSTLARTTLPAGLVDRPSRGSGRACLHGPHHSAHRSTTTGTDFGALDHLGGERGVGDVDGHGRQSTGGGTLAHRA